MIGRGDVGFNEASKVWNGFVDAVPIGVWICKEEKNVVEALNASKECGFTIKGGGHNVGGLALREGALCISLEGMRDVVVDVDKKRVTCGGGCLGATVDGATSCLQNLYVAGMGLISTTGIGGLASGGGVGWLARKWGLAIDNVESVDMVLANGSVVKGVCETHEPDLFWGVRGGGSNFGVITSFTFRLVTVHHVGITTFVFEDKIDDAMEAYVSLCAGAADQVTALGFLSSESCLIDRFVVMVAWIPEEGVDEHDILSTLASLEAATTLLKGICAWSQTEVVPLVELQRRFDAGNVGGRRYFWKSRFLNSWDEVRAAIKVGKHCLTHGAPSQGCSVEFVPFGGAIARNRGIGCFGHRDAVMEMHSIAVWDEAALDAKYVSWSRTFGDMLGGGSAGGNINILGPSQRGPDASKLAYGPHWNRLLEVKRKYDPDNRFRCNHNIQ